jgi:hypothetical protein
VDREAFAGWLWKLEAGMKVMRAPVGSMEFCSAATMKHVVKAEASLKGVGK